MIILLVTAITGISIILVRLIIYLKRKSAEALIEIFETKNGVVFIHSWIENDYLYMKYSIPIMVGVSVITHFILVNLEF